MGNNEIKQIANSGGRGVNICIRLATERDWGSINEIEQSRYGREGYSPYFIRMIPLLFSQTCWIAEGKGVPVGYCLGAVEDSKTENGWLLSVVVRKDWGNRGIATVLCNTCVEALKEIGARKIKLTVAPENEPARKIYENLGFVEIERVRDYYGPGEDRVVMVRESGGRVG